MIRLKKMLALAIAMIMVICTVNLAAFADPNSGDLTPDQKITITGLDKGDKVHLYQILVWEDGKGWRLNGGETGPYASLLSNENIKKLIDNDANGGNPIELTKTDLEAVATAAKAGGTDIGGDEALEGDTYTKNADTPGMFLALVTPGKAGVVYNPIIVSADFSATPNTSEIDASNSSMVLGNIAVAKKETISVDKVVVEGSKDVKDDHTHNVGDIVKFEITTKIPAYSASYDNPSFTITDTLSNGLVVVKDADHPFTLTTNPVVATADGYQEPDDGVTSFTVDFKSDAIKALVDYADVTITYYAKITGDVPKNVNEQENTVEVEFSNDPHSDSNKGKIKDKTKHYTFTIDGELLGEEGFRVIELLKVGKNADGTDAFEEIEISNGTKAAALDGAVFGLYKTFNGADKEIDSELYKNDNFEGTVETDKGLLVIPGLDADTYYLKELKAPKGYIRDQHVYEIKIEANIVDEETKENIDGIEVTYSVPVLKGYTVTIDNKDVTNTTTYTATISGSETLEKITPDESTTEIANTKGVELPATGGMGTTIFYIIGTILVLGAGILLVTRRRMNME